MPVESGNARVTGERNRGWFVGPYVGGPGALAHQQGVEVKWGIHSPGERRDEWGVNATWSMSVLLRGQFTLIFPDSPDVTLAQEGDYAIWTPGTPHRWHAVEESVVLTVRWPSAAT